MPCFACSAHRTSSKVRCQLCNMQHSTKSMQRASCTRNSYLCFFCFFFALGCWTLRSSGLPCAELRAVRCSFHFACRHVAPNACWMLHGACCISFVAFAAQVAHVASRAGFCCLNRAALRCTRVQDFQGSVLHMSSGDAMFEAVAISITNANEVTRKVVSSVMRARSKDLGRCLAGSEDWIRHPRAYELARQRHGAQDVRWLHHRSPHDPLG
jgi:hypothetical protein